MNLFSRALFLYCSFMFSLHHDCKMSWLLFSSMLDWFEAACDVTLCRVMNTLERWGNQCSIHVCVVLCLCPAQPSLPVQRLWISTICCVCVNVLHVLFLSDRDQFCSMLIHFVWITPAVFICALAGDWDDRIISGIYTFSIISFVHPSQSRYCWHLKDQMKPA